MKKTLKKTKTSKQGKTCKHCGHVIYYSPSFHSYRCMCDKAEPRD